MLEKKLVEKDESKQISLLKEQHEEEIRELKRSKWIVENNHCFLIKRNLKNLDELDKLKKELEEKELLIEKQKEQIAAAELDAQTHFEALTDVSKEWNEKKLKWWVGKFYKKLLDLNVVRNWTIEHNENTYNIKTKDLENKISRKSKEIEEKSMLLDEVNEILEEKNALITKLQKELEGKSTLLDEVNEELVDKSKQIKKVKSELEDEKNKTKELEKKVDLITKLFTKKLPSLPEKAINFKVLGKKLKTNLHRVIKREKVHEEQKMVARVEVRTK